MSVPYLFKFRSAVFCNAAACSYSYDSSSQINVADGMGFVWSASSNPNHKTTTYTHGHSIPTHQTATGRWIPGRWVNGKYDKRLGK